MHENNRYKQIEHNKWIDFIKFADILSLYCDLRR
jgi:hypothetical protein